MRRILFLALACGLALPLPGLAAGPLRGGEIVVSGCSYEGYPEGACPGRICRVDPDLGVVEPISAAIPSSTGIITDLAVESPGSVLAIAWELLGSIGTLLQIDVNSGVVTPLASGFAVWSEPNITVAQGGRVFVSGSAGILEIDLATGAATPLGQIISRSVTCLEMAANGDRFAFERTGLAFDGALRHWTPSGWHYLGGGEANHRPASAASRSTWTGRSWSPATGTPIQTTTTP